MLLCTPFVIQNLVLDDWNFARASYMFFFICSRSSSLNQSCSVFTSILHVRHSKLSLQLIVMAIWRRVLCFITVLCCAMKAIKLELKLGLVSWKYGFLDFFVLFRWTVTCPFQMKDHSVKKSCGGILNDWCDKSKICNIHHLIYECLC